MDIRANPGSITYQRWINVFQKNNSDGTEEMMMTLQNRYHLVAGIFLAFVFNHFRLRRSPFNPRQQRELHPGLGQQDLRARRIQAA